MNTQEIDDLSIEQLAAMMGDIDIDEIMEEKEKVDVESELSSEDFSMLKELEELELDIDYDNLEESELSKAIKKIAQSEAMDKMLDEAYEEQDMESDFIEKMEVVTKPIAEDEEEEDDKKDEEVVAKSESKPTSEKSIKTSKTKARASRPSKGGELTREDELRLGACPEFYKLEEEDLLIDPDDTKTLQERYVEVTNKINKMNVKTGAKCINLLCALNGTTKMTTFVESGVRYVTDDGNTITREDFINYFMSYHRNKVKSYNKSTALPQATTLLSLFVDLSVLTREGKNYTVNPNSLLIKSMKKYLSTKI